MLISWLLQSCVVGAPLPLLVTTSCVFLRRSRSRGSHDSLRSRSFPRSLGGFLLLAISMPPAEGTSPLTPFLLWVSLQRRIEGVYRRALIAGALYAEFWERFARWKAKTYGPAVAVGDLYAGVSVFLPNRPDLQLLYARLLECAGSVVDARSVYESLAGYGQLPLSVVIVAAVAVGCVRFLFCTSGVSGLFAFHLACLVYVCSGVGKGLVEAVVNYSNFERRQGDAAKGAALLQAAFDGTPVVHVFPCAPSAVLDGFAAPSLHAEASEDPKLFLGLQLAAYLERSGACFPLFQLNLNAVWFVLNASVPAPRCRGRCRGTCRVPEHNDAGTRRRLVHGMAAVRSV